MLKAVKGSFVSESTAVLSLIEQWDDYYSGSIFSVNNKESVPEKLFITMLLDFLHVYACIVKEYILSVNKKNLLLWKK